ncbi:MAG: bifunctional phosphoribosyl-AMP cyclohydrolase/phosphoribosyl-ATP diphosphatase HisIE [Candidatus Vogelbacteria bacterium]|nr:bifunctional phosphoribosyl-AMP cyclohydrolase/phosphoribosyl-ATP diphosphatase HisIE [Candidatus Vogelbacteria bacterium]
MLIPSIDIMDGRAVQLRRGKDPILTSIISPVILAKEFNRYGPVAVVDLDAVFCRGSNFDLVAKICHEAEVYVGGGVRDVEYGKKLLRAGAKKLVIGTMATPEFLRNFNPDQIIVALDHIDGTVMDRGWTNSTGVSLTARAKEIEEFCSGYLVTFIKSEGCLSGISEESVLTLQKGLGRPITIAGGISTSYEAAKLMRLGVSVQIGMALYTGALDLAETIVKTVDFEKMGGLVPTIVQEETTKQVLVLAYSSPESLTLALREGRGIYFSRSRKEVWRKGEMSGNTEELVSCRFDCDQDALLFVVRQKGPACHTGERSCFGSAEFSLSVMFSTLAKRMSEMPEGSYSTELFQNSELLIDKIFEESSEVVNFTDRDNLRWEIADLLFHLSVLATKNGLDWKDIESELRSRHLVLGKGRN